MPIEKVLIEKALEEIEVKILAKLQATQKLADICGYKLSDEYRRRVANFELNAIRKNLLKKKLLLAVMAITLKVTLKNCIQNFLKV